MMIERDGTVTSDNYIRRVQGAGLATLGGCRIQYGEGHNKELLVTSNRKFTVSAIFLGLLLLASARASQAQATSPARSVDFLATNTSSSTVSTANAAVTDSVTSSDSESVAAVPSSGDTAASAASDSDWHFTVSPYLWFAGVHGSVGGPNGGQIGFSASPGDMLSHVRFGLMGVAEPRYKRILMPLDIMWIRLGSDKALPNTPSQGVANVRATEFVL